MSSIAATPSISYRRAARVSVDGCTSPLLYWTTCFYCVGVPNFIHFDTTGRTHTQGLFNATSILQILLTLSATYVLAVVLLLSRRGLMVRRVPMALWLWLPLLGILVISTSLTPPSLTAPPTITGTILAFYRLFEWILGAVLIAAVYSRTPQERAAEMMAKLIGRVAWIWVTMVWLILPVMPKQVYGGSEDSAQGVSQLGGQLLGPSYLATLAIAAFFFSLFYFRPGLTRWIGCGVAVVTLALAHTRIEQVSFLCLLVVYAIGLSGRSSLRAIAIALIMLIGSGAALFHEALLHYLGRGQSLQTLETLDDRTRVWKAGLEAVALRPWIGYGFVTGAKNALQDHWTFAHWTPPHAHNELIQAALSGGIGAVLLVLALYGYMVFQALRRARRGRAETLFSLMSLLFALRSIGGPNLMVLYTRAGAVFLLTFLAIAGGSADAPVVAVPHGTRRRSWSAERG